LASRPVQGAIVNIRASVRSHCVHRKAG
jgi:hypothetical protein